MLKSALIICILFFLPILKSYSQVSRFSKSYSIPKRGDLVDFEQLDDALQSVQTRIDNNSAVIQNKINRTSKLIDNFSSTNARDAAKYQKKLDYIIDILNGNVSIKYTNGSLVENDISNPSFYNYILKQLNSIEQDVIDAY